MSHCVHNHSGDGFVKVWGTQPSSIDKAEDRDLWMDLLTRLDIKQPSGRGLVFCMLACRCG